MYSLYDIVRIKNRALCRSNRYFTNQKLCSLQKQSIFCESKIALSAGPIDIFRVSDPPPPPTMLRRQAIFFEQPASLSDGQTANADATNLHAPQNRKHACNECNLYIIICAHWQLITYRVFGPSENASSLLRRF